MTLVCGSADAETGTKDVDSRGSGKQFREPGYGSLGSRDDSQEKWGGLHKDKDQRRQRQGARKRTPLLPTHREGRGHRAVISEPSALSAASGAWGRWDPRLAASDPGLCQKHSCARASLITINRERATGEQPEAATGTLYPWPQAEVLV